MDDQIGYALETLQSDTNRCIPCSPAAVRRRGDRRRTTSRLAATGVTVTLVGATAGTAFAVAQQPAPHRDTLVPAGQSSQSPAPVPPVGSPPPSLSPAPVASLPPTGATATASPSSPPQSGSPDTPTPTPTGRHDAGPSTPAGAPGAEPTSTPTPTAGYRGTAQPTASPTSG